MSEQCHSPTHHQHFTVPLPDLAALDTLPTLTGHYSLVNTPQPDNHEQQIHYFDTADYRLLRTGFAVCATQTGEQLSLTFADWAVGLTGKLDKQIRRRTTRTEPIASLEVATTPKAWPKALRKAVAPVLTGHAKLHPILVVQRQRTTRLLAVSSVHGTATPDTATPQATLQFDILTAWQPQEEGQPLETTAAITQLGHLTVALAAEAPPDAGPSAQSVTAPATAAQDALITWLANQPGMMPAATPHQPVLEQALLAASRHLPGLRAANGLQPHLLVADGCRLIWREQLMLLLLNEAGVRYSQDREYVHEMRVAIRRARAAANLYGDFLPRKLIRPYLATLRKTGRLLGHIRNLDVALTKARRPRKQEGQAGAAPKKLLKIWRQQRQVAQQKLIHWLDSDEYSDFLIEFQHFCAIPEAQSKHHAIPLATPVPQQIRHVIPTQILEGYAAVRCYEALFAAATPVNTATFHELRIACKYLRYNLEFARHLLGPECEPLITHLKALQELLGDLNDAVVAQLLVDEADQGDNTAAYQHTQAALVTELSQRVPMALAALTDQPSRTQLAQALAQL